MVAPTPERDDETGTPRHSPMTALDGYLVGDRATQQCCATDESVTPSQNEKERGEDRRQCGRWSCERTSIPCSVMIASESGLSRHLGSGDPSLRTHPHRKFWSQGSSGGGGKKFEELPSESWPAEGFTRKRPISLPLLPRVGRGRERAVVRGANARFSRTAQRTRQPSRRSLPLTRDRAERGALASRINRDAGAVLRGTDKSQ